MCSQRQIVRHIAAILNFKEFFVSLYCAVQFIYAEHPVTQIMRSEYTDDVTLYTQISD